MSTANATLRVSHKFFTVIALLVALVALYQWATYALVWSDSWAFAQALTWSFLTVVAFVPVLGLERLQNRGD